MDTYMGNDVRARPDDLRVRDFTADEVATAAAARPHSIVATNAAVPNANLFLRSDGLMACVDCGDAPPNHAEWCKRRPPARTILNTDPAGRKAWGTAMMREIEQSTQRQRLVDASAGASGLGAMVAKGIDAYREELARLRTTLAEVTTDRDAARALLAENRARAQMTNTEVVEVPKPATFMCLSPGGSLHNISDKRLVLVVREGAAHEKAVRFESGPAPTPVASLTDRMRADPSFAWAWHCNIAMPMKDSSGVTHEQANRAAAHVMRHLFDVDVTLCPEWKALEAAWNADKPRTDGVLPAPYGIGVVS